MCDMTHSYVRHDWLVCVTWLIRATWHFHMCVLLIHKSNMTHSYVGHDSFICMTWLIHVCNMTHSYVWHDSFICATQHFRQCDQLWRVVLPWAGNDEEAQETLMVCCSQCVAVCCSACGLATMSGLPKCYRVLWTRAPWNSHGVLQSVCCSVWQCVAACVGCQQWIGSLIAYIYSAQSPTKQGFFAKKTHNIRFLCPRKYAITPHN